MWFMMIVQLTKTVMAWMKMWYALNKGLSCNHLSHEVTTIKYYFEEASKDGTYTWTTDVSESVAQEIKTAYANSMKKME